MQSAADDFDNIYAIVWKISLMKVNLLKRVEWQKENLLNTAQCFQEPSAADASKGVYTWDRVQKYSNSRS